MTTSILLFFLKKARRLRNDVPYFNQCGVDGLIVKKRPGTMAITNGQQALSQIHQLVPLATKVLTTLLARLKSDRANLADDESTLVQ